VENYLFLEDLRVDYGQYTLLMIELSSVLELQIPKKLLFRNGMHFLPSENSRSTQGFCEKWVKSCLSIFSPKNVHSSSMGQSSSEDSSSCSGSFGFIRMLDMSAVQASFLPKASGLERCLFALLHSNKLCSVECYRDLSKVITLDEHKSKIHTIRKPVFLFLFSKTYPIL